MFLKRELNIQFKASLLFVCFPTSETWSHMPHYRNRMFPQGLYVPRMVKPFRGKLDWEGLRSLGFCAEAGLWGSGLFLFLSSFPVLTTTCQVLPWCSSPQPWNRETIRPWTGDSKTMSHGQLFSCEFIITAIPVLQTRTSDSPLPKMVLRALALELLSVLTWDISYVSRVNPDSCLTLLHDLGKSTSTLRISLLVFLSVNVHLPAPHW